MLRFIMLSVYEIMNCIYVKIYYAWRVTVYTLRFMMLSVYEVMNCIQYVLRCVVLSVYEILNCIYAKIYGVYL